MWFSEMVQGELPIEGVRFNWMPSWWYRNYGIAWGHKMVFDADYRLAAYLEMRRSVWQRYGQADLGSPDPQPCVLAPDWQNAQTPAVAGCRVEYPEDNYPVSYHLPQEDVPQLRVPEDITTTYPFCESIRQVGYLNRKLGMDAAPLLNVRGVLNDACLIAGEQVLGDLAEPHGWARHLLDYTHALGMATLRHNHSVARDYRHILCNCTEIMVGPSTYARTLMPYDQETYATSAALGRGCGIHHCGKFDAYAPLYRRLGQSSFLEIGHESDLRLALELFPETHISYIVPTALVCQGSRTLVGDRIDAILESARGHWRRLSLNVADLEYGMPDENLFEIYARLKRALP
jgi:hypothetical protein